MQPETSPHVLAAQNNSESRPTHRFCCWVGLTCAAIFFTVGIMCIGFGQWTEADLQKRDVEPSLIGMRAGLFLIVWIFGFAINTYVWRRVGLHNVSVFEFIPEIYLNFEELFVVAGLVTAVWIAGMYLIAFSPWLHIPLYVGPLLVYGVLASVLFLPLPILRHRSRIWLMKKLGRIVCAPFFYVTFADFWLADQWTSLRYVLLDGGYLLCFLSYGRNSHDTVSTCDTGSYGLRVIVAVLPEWWRFAQCMRRYHDTWQANPHLINAGKYSTTFFVVVFLTLTLRAYNDELSQMDQSVTYWVFFALWLLSAIVETLYKLLWDIFMDWGFFTNLQLCKLRHEKIYTRNIYYVLAFVENVTIRLTWLVGGLLIHIKEARTVAVTIVGVLEVIRRIVWNIFRFENEHVSNVGQFRIPAAHRQGDRDNLTADQDQSTEMTGRSTQHSEAANPMRCHQLTSPGKENVQHFPITELPHNPDM